MKRRLLLFLTMCIGLVSSAWALDKVGDVYQIGTAQDLADFSALVNSGELEVNAVLTDDIDMSGLMEDEWVAIGDWGGISGTSSAGYKGHFNGQGHTIKNFNFNATHNYFALFGIIWGSALVENFTIEGTISVDGGYQYVAGVAAYTNNTPTIRNVHSKVNINSTSTVGTPRLGGVVGGCPAQNSKTVIDRCTYSGTLNANDKGGNYGGIVGYILNNANVTVDITNCLFDGKLQGEITTNSAQLGGIIGYTRKGIVSVNNCLSIGTIEYEDGNAMNVGQFVGRITYDSNTTGLTFANNYYKDTGIPVNGTSGGAGKGTAPVAVTAEQLASGEIAYALNDDQSTISWFQNLSDDDYPIPYGTDMVYLAGRQHCDGSAYDGTTYSNENLGVVKDEHDFVDGFCSYCSALDKTYIFEIGTPAQLISFAAVVNTGGECMSANAVLTNDIDMTGQPWENAIGNYVNSVGYKGHFDGQGYAIRGLEYTTNKNYHGLFGVLIDGAVVENFSVYGTITNEGYDAIAAIAYSKNDSEPNYIRNIHSYLNITSSGSDKKVGGILGNGNAGTTYVDRCIFSGSISSTNKTNCGGIVAYIQNNSGAHVNISNCIFDGTLESEISNTYCGGIVGYIGASSSVYTITNCLSFGTVTGPIAGSIFGYVRNAGGGFSNNYYFGSATSGKSDGDYNVAISVSEEQLASGEIAYVLNGDQSAIAFYQTLPDDDVPTLDNTHKQVYANGRQHCDGSAYEGTTYSNENLGVVKDEHDFVDGFCSYCDIFDESYSMTPNAEGYYEIGSANQLRWFAIYSNTKDHAAKAILTDDIALTKAWTTPIGTGSGNVAPGATAYTGIFNGQGHDITGFSAVGTGHLGLFGDANGATIKNFSISGSVNVTEGYCAGVVANLTNSTIENVHSALVIDAPNGDTHHVGGVAGSARGGNTISGCSFSGSLTVASSTDNFAGIAAYITNGDMVINCANYGNVTFSASGCAAGGIVGYVNAQQAYIQNCLSTGKIRFDGEGTPKYGAAIIGRTKGFAADKVTNNYWLEGSAYGTIRNNDGSEAMETGSVSTEQLASGEIAYKLGAAFSQLIGTNAYPAFGDAPVSYVGDAGYATMYDATTGYKLNGDVTANVATLNNGKWLKLAEIENVPAGTPVILKGTYYNKLAADLPAINIANDLKGTAVDTEADGTMYVLAKPEGKEVGFYQVYEGDTIKAGKAYYQSASGVKAFYFDGEDATGISTIDNGQLTIDNSVIYNVAGQKLSKMQKGINIVNGKKVLK